MSKSRGPRRRSRHILRKSPRERGKLPLSRLIREYEVGDKVAIIIDPAIHKGMPHRRYHGKIGTIGEKRGKAYVVNLKEGGKTRYLIVRPEHIRPHKN